MDRAVVLQHKVKQLVVRAKLYLNSIHHWLPAISTQSCFPTASAGAQNIYIVIFVGKRFWSNTEKSISAITCCSLEFLTGSCQQIWLGTTPDQSNQVHGSTWELAHWQSAFAVSSEFPLQFLPQISKGEKVTVPIFPNSHMAHKKIPPGHSPTLWSQESSVSHVVSSVLLLNTVS